MSHETIKELTERRDLLKEIAELKDEVPSEEEMESLAEYVSNLTALTNLNADIKIPNEEEMEALAQHLANLRALADATA